MTYIYLITNCFNIYNNVYIGKTTSPKARKSKHKYTYGNKIEFTIIDSIDSIDRSEWKPLENYWIEQFTQWGFNVQNKNIGGNGPTHRTPEQIQHLKTVLTGIKKGPWSQERKEKFSSIVKGISKPDGFGAARSEKLKGKPNPGVSAKLLGKPKPHKYNPTKGKSKPGAGRTIPYSGIAQLNKITGELITVFLNQTDAGLALGKNGSAIGECCNGKRNSAYGYKWVWLPRK